MRILVEWGCYYAGREACRGSAGAGAGAEVVNAHGAAEVVNARGAPQ